LGGRNNQLSEWSSDYSFAGFGRLSQLFYSKMIYSPAEDSFLIEKYIKQFSKDKSVLDMGTGSGILAETALAAGAKSILAVDINPEAVQHVNKKGISSRVSDLFSEVPESFDIIIFNPPYLPRAESEDFESETITTGGSQGHEIIQKFLQEAKPHLDSDGKILLLFSSLTGKEKVDNLITKEDYKFKCLETKKMFFEELFVYLIAL